MILGSQNLPSVLGSWIDGSYIDGHSGRQFTVHNPSTGAALTKLDCANTDQVNRAVESSREAFSVWRRIPHRKRGLMLRHLADEMDAHAAEFAHMETLNTGKSLSESLQDVKKSAEAFAFYSELADKTFGRSIPISDDYHSYTRLEPRGVTVHISPWNYPLRLAVRSLAPALACGNTVILKPSEHTPLTALMLAELFQSCGFPEGVMNIVCGVGEDCGAALAGHPDINHVAFTGSVPSGITVARLAAGNVVPAVLELGGKSANIVFADCDIDLAVAGVLKGIFTNAGQVCCSGSRLVVQESIKDEFVGRLVAAAEAMSVGPGINNPDMGPLITKEQHQRVLEFIRKGQEEGAVVLTGGQQLSGGKYESGFFIQPTIFDNVRNSMHIAREEIFGPVLCAIPFKDDAEALAIANDSPYGLVAGIWTSNLSRAHRLSAELEVGQVFVNDFFSGSIANPFGGYKRSGFGRERGVEALENYTQVKSVCIKL